MGYDENKNEVVKEDPKPRRRVRAADSDGERDATVVCELLNVRNKINGVVIGKIPKGTTVHVIEEDEGWAKIACYVKREFVK